MTENHPRPASPRPAPPRPHRRWPRIVGVALGRGRHRHRTDRRGGTGRLPASPRLDAETQKVAAGIIFAGSYLALAIGKIPGLSIDRAGVALVGACLMVVSGAFPLEDAYRAIDLDTITLLLGMMIVVASLRLSGFFAIATAWVMRAPARPVFLLGAVTATRACSPLSWSTTRSAWCSPRWCWS